MSTDRLHPLGLILQVFFALFVVVCFLATTGEFSMGSFTAFNVPACNISQYNTSDILFEGSLAYPPRVRGFGVFNPATGDVRGSNPRPSLTATHTRFKPLDCFCVAVVGLVTAYTGSWLLAALNSCRLIASTESFHPRFEPTGDEIGMGDYVAYHCNDAQWWFNVCAKWFMVFGNCTVARRRRRSCCCSSRCAHTLLKRPRLAYCVWLLPVDPLMMHVAAAG